MSELDNYDTGTLTGCSKPLQGCAVAIGLSFLVLIGMLLYVQKVPSIKNRVICQSHLEELGKAINRYKNVTGYYPIRLIDLKKEFLKDTAYLKCPLDTSTAPTSYLYIRPTKSTAPKAIMLECDKHGGSNLIPFRKLQLTKDGKIKTPTMKQIIKASEQESKQRK